VHDWGLPLTSSGGDFGPLPEPLAALTPADANLQLLNLGSDGKRLVAQVSVSSSGDREARRHHIEAAARRTRMRAETPDAIEVRAATPEDAEAIAQLLYENYHLSFVHVDFYRPRYLMAALASGGLVSTIALHDGRVIGHHALLPLPGVPSAETGAAGVHSTYRGLGIFGRLSEHTLDEASVRGLASVFDDAVTIHPFSQRAEHSHGYRETALQPCDPDPATGAGRRRSGSLVRRRRWRLVSRSISSAADRAVCRTRQPCTRGSRRPPPLARPRRS
jgi:N-acetylglutamate synthase-like GNAT family acetyltransferase